MTIAHKPQSGSPAPWAEVVPGVGPLTMADYLAYPANDGYQYELVDGVLVRMAGTRPEAGDATRALLFPLAAYVQAHGLGVVTLPDEVYDFERTGQPNTGLLPDVGFYDASRASQVTPHEPRPFAPDLAAEVAGGSQRQADMDAKARRYLRGGTALVWVVWPERRQVDVWHHDGHAPVGTLGDGDQLDGLDVVPGFTLPVARLFA